jgi:flagellar motor component MotA
MQPKEKIMKKSYLIFAILTLLVVLGTTIMGGESILIFLDIPSMLMVCLISIFLLLTNYSPSEIVLAFTIGFKKEELNRKDLQKSINLFDSLGKYLILSAILGSITGFIAMASYYSRDTNNLGSGDWAGGSALAILTIVYSLIFYMLIAVPFKNGLKNRLIEIE